MADVFQNIDNIKIIEIDSKEKLEKKVTLRKFTKNDIEDKIRWINDSSNNKYLHYYIPLAYDKTLNWYNANKDRTDRYDAVIQYDGISVGIIGLLNIDVKNKKAEYYITMGEHDYKGKGIATTASKLLFIYAFEKLGLNKIYLYTEVENEIAQHLFEKIGFKKEGKLIEDLIINDRKIDRYVYGILKKDYK